MTTTGPGEPVAELHERRPWPLSWCGWFARAQWWVHVAATFGAVLVAIATAAVVAAFLYVDYAWETTSATTEIPPQTPIVGAEAADLARRFAPELRYDTGELFVPISRAAYFSRTQLKEQDGKLERLLQAMVTEDTLLEERPASCPPGCFLFLDVRGVEPKPPKHSERTYNLIEDKLLRSGARPTVYYHVTRYDDTDEIAVQFWFLYFFNYRLNEHESDWEQITVRLDEDRNPIGVFYSAHEGGNDASWERVESPDADHPVVFPARGSHANYLHPGKKRVAVVCKRVLGVLKHCVKGRSVIVDISDGRGIALGEGDYDLTELTGPLFIGSYGSGNYVVLTRKADVLRDPRVRSAWVDPLQPFLD